MVLTKLPTEGVRLPGQTLILTNSRDLTVDRLVNRIGTDRIFRFNLDIWEDYQIYISRGDFGLANPTGRSIRRAEVMKCLWRKPMMKSQLYWQPGIPQESFYLELEVERAVREIRNILRRDGKLVLIEPAADEWLGKLAQMDVAVRYFRVPDYEFSYPPRAGGLASGPIVVKSLSGERVKPDHYVWTTAVEAQLLDASLPWFKQAKVDASHDVTVVFIRGDCFGFDLDRSLLEGETVDWRVMGPAATRHWRRHPLPAELCGSMAGFMEAIGLQFGRLDFLYDRGSYLFLEVNANGEWDWLDPDQGKGVVDRIVEEIHPDTPIHPLPPR